MKPTKGSRDNNQTSFSSQEHGLNIQSLKQLGNFKEEKEVSSHFELNLASVNCGAQKLGILISKKRVEEERGSSGQRREATLSKLHRRRPECLLDSAFAKKKKRNSEYAKG